MFYFWFDTQSNPPANIKDVTTGSQLDLPSERAAYEHEQDHWQQYVSSILANQFNGMPKFQGFIQTFEMLIEEHDEAGRLGYQVAMTPQKKRRLLIAALRDSTNPPASGVDGRRFKGPQTYIADLELDKIDMRKW